MRKPCEAPSTPRQVNGSSRPTNPPAARCARGALVALARHLDAEVPIQMLDVVFCFVNQFGQVGDQASGRKTDRRFGLQEPLPSLVCSATMHVSCGLPFLGVYSCRP